MKEFSSLSSFVNTCQPAHQTNAVSVAIVLLFSSKSATAVNLAPYFVPDDFLSLFFKLSALALQFVLYNAIDNGCLYNFFT
jgi:hypothetical protein